MGGGGAPLQVGTGRMAGGGVRGHHSAPVGRDEHTAHARTSIRLRGFCPLVRDHKHDLGLGKAVLITNGTNSDCSETFSAFCQSINVVAV